MTGAVGGKKSRMLTRKQLICTIIIGLIAVLLLAVAISYAVYSARIAGWEQSIYVQSFSFTLNGNEIGTDNTGTINNENGTLNLLAKGQEADFTLAVEARGYATGKLTVPYTINLTLDSSYPNNELAKAIEVYEFSDGEYSYVSMLDEFLSDSTVSLSDGAQVQGRQITGHTGINGASTHKYRLVYSLGAGEYYEGKSFSIYAEATYTTPEYTNTEYYIYSERDLADAANSDTDNVTLVLLKDIELTGKIEFTRKVGLDLNGHVLITPVDQANQMTISYSESYTDPTSPQFGLKIFDSVGTGAINPENQQGTPIAISAPNDILLISDALSDNSMIATSYPDGFSQSVFAVHAQHQLTELCKKPVSGTATTVDFTKGLKRYIGYSAQTALALTDTDVVSSISGGVCTLNSAVIAANTFTNTYYIQFTAYSTPISGELTILGNSMYSIARRVIDDIPEVIHSSLFLPIYDDEAKANLTWVTMRPEMLTTDGVFLKDGYASFPDWTNQLIDLGVIVEMDGERYAAAFSREVCILTAEERTRLLFDYVEATLDIDAQTPDLSVYTLFDSTNNTGHISLDSAFRTKLGYRDSKIVIDVSDLTTSNPNYTGNADSPWYVEYNGDSYEGEGYKSVKMVVKPTSIGALVVPSDLTFYYSNTSGRAMDYSEERPMLVLGTNRITTLDDPTITLQIPFTENNYVDGDGTYSFFADGSYNNGSVLVEYSIPADSEWATNDILEVVNGLYVEDPEGYFYREADGSFVLFAEGQTPAGTVRYSRKSLVIVKPENVTTETKTATINAKLIQNTAPGSQTYQNSLYLDPLNITGTVYSENWGTIAKDYVKENGADVVYDLSLVVEGIYHQRPLEIADANLYALLCRSYDRNNDDYISVSEALLDPIPDANGSARLGTYFIPTGDSVQYLKLSSAGISSLKGIEYFKNITGLDLATRSGGTSKNSIIDISYLSNLEKIKYLNMADNSVSDITPLQYLDNLVYINFENAVSGTPDNNITDLTAIKYLPNVHELDFSDNNNLADVEAIVDYKNLYRLDVRTEALTGVYNQYYLTLIYGANSAHFTSSGRGVYYVHGSNSAYVPSADVITAAQALENLTVINETFNTLNLKSEQTLNDNSFYFQWVTSSPYLNFTTVTDGGHQKTTEYTLTSPIVDTPVEIIIYVDGDSTSYDTIARKFTFNLLQLSGFDNMTFIECDDGMVKVLSEAVPDIILRSLLFEKFNNSGDSQNVYVNTDTNLIVAAASGSTVTVNHQNIITQTEINYMKTNVANTDNLTFGNKGIKTLTGISEFADGIVTLDLRGNVFTPNETTGLSDISELSELSLLQTLYLDGQSFDFTQLSHFSETAPTEWTADYTGTSQYGSGLTSLEHLSVYGSYGLDNEETQSALYQVYLMNKNVEIYINAAYTGTAADAANVWNPYIIPLALYSNSMPSTFTYVDLETKSTCLYVDDNGVLRVNVEKNGDYYYYNFFFYGVRHIKFRITGMRNFSAPSVSNTDYIESVAVNEGGTEYITGFRYKKLIGYTMPQFTRLTMSGAESLSFAQDANVGRNDTVTGTHYVEQCLEFNHHIKLVVDDSGKQYSLNELFPGRTLIEKIMGNYVAGSGLLIGTETETFLSGTYDSVTGDTIYTLGDNVLYIGSSFQVTGLFLAGGESSIQGLQYTSATTLSIGREAILGTGEWLQNVSELYIAYSAIDLSSLTMPLPNLTKIVIGKTANDAKVKECWDINMYNAAMYDISDTTSDIYKYIVGLNTEYERYSHIYDENELVTAAYYLNNSLQKEAVCNSPEVAATYAVLREIARSKDTNGNYAFYMNYIPNLAEFEVLNTTGTYDWTGLLAYMFNSDTSDSNYDASDISSLIIYNRTGPHNSNGGIAEPIIRKLYQAYETANGIAPSYQIGTIDHDDATDIYDPLTFHATYYTHDVNYGLYDASRTAAREKNEFASSVLDLGVKLGDTLHYNSQTQAVAAGTKIYLPATTAHVMFGTADNAQFFRDLPITWQDSAGNAVSGTPNADGYIEITTAANANGTDKYMYYKGTMGGREFYYPVLINGTTADSAIACSFDRIDDLQLRMALFLALGKPSSSVYNPASVTTLSFTDSSVSTNVATVALTAALKKVASGIATLDGLEDFSALTSVDFKNQFISDASALSGLTGLTSVSIENCLLPGVSWASGLTNCTTFSLKENPIVTTKNSTSTYFPASAQTIDLSGCGSINATDISAMSTLPALATLNISNTLAEKQFETLAAIRTAVTGSGRANATPLNITMSNGAFPTLTKTNYGAVTALMDFLTASSTSNTTVRKLLSPAAGERFKVGEDFFPVENGVTFTVANNAIYDGSVWQTAKMYSYSDFQMNFTFGNFGGYNYNGYKASLPVYVNYADRTAEPSLRFYTNTAKTTYVDVAYADLDHDIYMYITTSTASSWTHAPNGDFSMIEYPYSRVAGGENVAYERTIDVSNNIGITTLKGLEKIPGLKTISIKNNPVSELGFTSSNSSITDLTLGGCAMSEEGLMSISYLTALEDLDLRYVTGVHYNTGASTLASKIKNIEKIYLNNEYDYLLSADNSTGIASDAKFFNSTSAGTFGGKAISSFSFDMLRFIKAYNWHNTDASAEHAYETRSQSSEVYANALWWNGNSYATKFKLNTMTKFGTDTYGSAWSKLIKYLSQMPIDAEATNNGLASGLLALPNVLNYADFAGVDPNFADPQYYSVSFNLPKKFWLFSTEYSVSWSVGKLTDPTENASATTPISTFITDNGTYYTLTLASTDQNALDLEDGDKIKITGSAGGGSASHIFKINRDATAKYYQRPSTNSRISEFYIEMEDGQIVMANQFFPSYRLLYWLYNHTATDMEGLMRDSGGTELFPQAHDGPYSGKFLSFPSGTKYLSYSTVLSVNTLEIRSETGIGIANLSGIELFENLKRFRVNQGYPTSIEPLRNLKLESFVYANSDTNESNAIIQDWTPLYNSRETLTNFTYIGVFPTGGGIVYNEDYSFLMSFSALSTVQIGVSALYSAEGAGTNRMPGFKYMLAWFYLNNVNLTLTYNGVPVYQTGAYDPNALLPESVSAALILKDFRATDDSEITYGNNFELFLKNYTTAQLQQQARTVKLPSYINHGGKLYPLEWISMSSFVSLACSDQNGTPISTATQSEINTEDEVYFNSASKDYAWQMTISSQVPNYLGTVRLICRIMTDDGIFERVFTINTFENNTYPSLTVWNSFASYALPVGAECTEDEESSSYYTILDNEALLGDNPTAAAAPTHDVIVLNPTAVGHDIYVNIDGVRTKIEFAADAAYFTKLSTLHSEIMADYVRINSVGTDYTMANYQTLKAKVEQYKNVDIGEWIYMEYVYPSDIASINQTIAALENRLESIISSPVAITYSGAGETYTNSSRNPSVWTPSYGTTSLSEPTAPNSMFLGWYTDSSFVNQITLLSDATMQSYIVSGSVTLYAKFFTSATLTYTTDKQNPATSALVGFTPNNPSTYTLGGTFSLADPTDVDEGMIFLGWYRESTYQNQVTQLSDADFIFGTNALSSLTLYARFKEGAVITYMTQDGTAFSDADSGITSTNPSVYIGAPFVLSDPVITDADLCSGKTFLGWYTEDGTRVEQIDSSFFTSVNRLSLYARFADKYLYLGVTMPNPATGFSSRASWATDTIYYYMTYGEIDKVQLNGETSRVALYATDTKITAPREKWFLDSELSSANKLLFDTVNKNELTLTGAASSLGNSSNAGGTLIQRMGSFKFTVDFTGQAVTDYYSDWSLEAEYCINGVTWEAAFDNGNSETRNYTVADNASYVYGLWGANADNTFGKWDSTTVSNRVGIDQVNKYNGTVKSGTMNYSAPNRFYTYVYLETIEGRDIYALCFSISAVYKIWQAFSDKSYLSTGSNNPRLDVTDTYNTAAKINSNATNGFRAPVVRYSGPYFNVFSGTSNTSAQYADGTNGASNNITATSGLKWSFFSPQGFRLAADATAIKYFYRGNSDATVAADFETFTGYINNN